MQRTYPLDTFAPRELSYRDMARRVFITVAEVSGDKHAAQLIRSLKQLDPELVIEGFGGPEMRAAGAIVHQETVANAAMGLRGLLRAGEVMRLLKWAKGHFAEHRPDLQIGVDSPSMNFHFAKVARAMNVPVMQYVAPQLWAWASWRMPKLRRLVDRVACILPFEEDYFRRHGVPATFVGHPLFDELPIDRATSNGSAAEGRVVGLLPGSRSSEARHNYPRLLRVADDLRARFPDLRFLVPTTAATHDIVRELTANRGLPIEIGRNQFDQMVPQCALCITVSGTATLHVAGFGVPMIVVYHVSPFAWNAGARWLVRTRTFALVNLLAQSRGMERMGSHLVPEFVPWYGSVEPVSQLATEYLTHPERLADQRDKLRHLVQSLDHPGASLNTAKLAMEMMAGGSGE